MKKGLTLALALLLVFTVALMATGCGSDKAQAQEYVKKGDDQLKSFESKTSAWNTKIISIGAIPATFAGDVQQARAAGDELLKTAQAAKTEFEKIKGLKGVGDYKKYADLRLAELDILDQIVKTMNEYLDTPVVMPRPGFPFYRPWKQQKAQNKIDALSEKGQKLEEEATKLKSDKKL